MRRNYFVGIVLITFGVLFLLDNLGVANFGDMIHDYWPLILILWGLSILLRRKTSPGESSAIVADSLDRELVHESNVFGNIFLSITSQHFKGGSISTVFGDCDLDLSSATIADGEHVLRVHSVFGDSSIILPKNTAVSVTASSTFGSLTVLGKRKDGFSSVLQATTPEYESSPNRLNISLNKVFGDTRIG